MVSSYIRCLLTVFIIAHTAVVTIVPCEAAGHVGDTCIPAQHQLGPGSLVVCVIACAVGEVWTQDAHYEVDIVV